LADHIVAGWPRELHEPTWLRSCADKTSYVGGISWFDGGEPELRENGSKPTVPVLVGAGGSDVTVAMVNACAEAHPAVELTALGVHGTSMPIHVGSEACVCDLSVGIETDPADHLPSPEDPAHRRAPRQ